MMFASAYADVNWGSSTQAQAYKSALSSAQQLNNVDEHVKNYRPQMLVLSGLPSQRPALVDFAYLITKHLSLMVCGQISKVHFEVADLISFYLKYVAYEVNKSVLGFIDKSEQSCPRSPSA